MKNKNILLIILSLVLIIIISTIIEYNHYRKTTTVDILGMNIPMFSVIGKVSDSRIITDGEKEGYLAYGPYIPLDKGEYEVKYKIKLNKSNPNISSTTLVGYCDIDIEGHPQLGYRADLIVNNFKNIKENEVSLRFTVPGGKPKIQYRVYQYGGNNLSVIGLKYYPIVTLKDFILTGKSKYSAKMIFIFIIIILFYIYIKLVMRNRLWLILLLGILSIVIEYNHYRKTTTVDILGMNIPMFSVIGKVSDSRIITDGEKEGYLAYGPYIPLDKGEYEVKYKIKLNKSNPNISSTTLVGYCDIDIEGHPQLGYRADLIVNNFKNIKENEVSLRFTVPGGKPKIQYRVYQYGGNNLSLIGLKYYPIGLRDFIIDKEGKLNFKTIHIFIIIFLVYMYIRLILKTKKNNLIKYFIINTITIVISGLIVALIWQYKNYSIHNYTDYYDMWKVFYAPLWMSLLFIFFNLLYLINNSFGFNVQIEKYLRYDRYSLVIIPIYILAELFYKNFNTQFVLGNFYLSTLIIKGLIYFSFLWQNIKDKNQIDKYLKWSIILSIFTIYFLITPWVNASFHSDGDESLYLLQTQSIIKDLDIDIKNNVIQNDSISYHPNLQWTKWHGSYSRPLTSYILIPGFLLLGRFGATMTMNLFGALLAINILLLAYLFSKSIKASFIAMMVTVFSCPVGIYSFLVYPEIIASLIMIYLIRKILLINFELNNIIVPVILIISIMLLKERYIVLVLALSILLIIKVVKNTRRLLLVTCMLIIVSIIFLIYDKIIWEGDIVKKIMFHFRNYSDYRQLLIGSLGLLLDQESGLLIYAPFYIFSTLGMLSLLKYNKKYGWMLLLLFSLYYLTIPTSEFWATYGSPASRYIVVVIPILSIAFSIYIIHLKKILLKILTIFLLGWSFIIYFILILIPQYRVHSPNYATGKNELLDRLYATGLFPNLTPYFSSFLKISDTTYYLIVLFVVVFVVLLIYYIKQENITAETYDKKKVLKITAVIVCIIGFLLVFAEISYYKYQVFEVEDYYTGGGTIWQEGLIYKGKGFFSLLKTSLRKNEEVNVKIIAKGDISKNLPEISAETVNNKDREKVGKTMIDSRDWKEYDILYKSTKGDLSPFWFIYDNYTEGKDVLIDKIIFSSIEKKSWLGFINYQLGKIDRRLGLIDYAHIRFEKAAKLGYKIEKK